MKNLQIGDNDLIGNKFNGHDLHIYLNKRGIESNHLIANPPQSRDGKTFQIGSDYIVHPFVKTIFFKSIRFLKKIYPRKISIFYS